MVLRIIIIIKSNNYHYQASAASNDNKFYWLLLLAHWEGKEAAAAKEKTWTAASDEIDRSSRITFQSKVTGGAYLLLLLGMYVRTRGVFQLRLPRWLYVTTAAGLREQIGIWCCGSNSSMQAMAPAAEARIVVVLWWGSTKFACSAIGGKCSNSVQNCSLRNISSAW